MKDSELKKIENDILNSIDSDIKQEQEVIAMSRDAAENLMSSKGKAVIQIQDYHYDLRYKISGKKIVMVASCIEKRDIVQNKYIPHIIQAEIQNDLSLFENLSSIVEAFTRHKLGMVKAEALD